MTIREVNTNKKFYTGSVWSTKTSGPVTIIGQSTEWHSSTSLREYDLDKDIKVPGNKVYGPDTCMFVKRTDNTLDAITRKKTLR